MEVIYTIIIYNIQAIQIIYIIIFIISTMYNFRIYKFTINKSIFFIINNIFYGLLYFAKYFAK